MAFAELVTVCYGIQTAVQKLSAQQLWIEGNSKIVISWITNSSSSKYVAFLCCRILTDGWCLFRQLKLW